MANLISAIATYMNFGETSTRKLDAIPSPIREKDSGKQASKLVCTHCQEKLNNCFQSQIDHSKKICTNLWAVSIVIAKKDWKVANLFSHHTMLIIEGFNTNGKFWRRAHLMGPGSFDRIEVLQDCFSGHSNIGQVELTDEKYSVFDLSRCKKNRQTWIISREKIEQLLIQIMWEQHHPEATPFRFLGEKSLVAVTKEFLDTRHPELLEIEKTNPQKFKKLCLLLKDKDFLQNFNKWYRKNQGSVATVSKTFLATTFIATIIATPVLALKFLGPKALDTAHLFLSYERTFIRSIQLMVLALGGIVCDAHFKRQKYETLVKEVKENDDQLRFIEDRAKIAVATSQNCFNWARKNLRAIDIVLAQKKFEMFIAIPEIYLPSEEKDTQVCSET